MMRDSKHSGRPCALLAPQNCRGNQPAPPHWGLQWEEQGGGLGSRRSSRWGRRSGGEPREGWTQAAGLGALVRAWELQPCPDRALGTQGR